MFNIYACKPMEGYKLVKQKEKEIATLKCVRNLLTDANGYYKILVIEKRPNGDYPYGLYFKGQKEKIKKNKRRF